MLFTVPELLSADGVKDLRARLEAVPLVDGKSTAGWHAKGVKQNQQLDAKAAKPLGDEVRSLILKHPLFQVAARPKQVQSIRFNRYTDGMFYGRHTDNALMNGIRTDLSISL